MYYQKIYDQLNDYCNCLDIDECEADKFLSQLIHLVSTMTCWRNSSCETFLKSERQEIFDVDYINNCSCDHGLMVVPLYYLKVFEPSIQVFVQIRDGIDFCQIQVEQEDYSFDSFTNEVYIDLKKYLSNGKCMCDCSKIHRIIISYVAGYDVIPDCILPIFCDLMDYIVELNSCGCGCQDCDSGSMEEEESDLSDNEKQQLIYDWIQSTVTQVYIRQLETMSLCGRNSRFIGVVV